MEQQLGAMGQGVCKVLNPLILNRTHGLMTVGELEFEHARIVRGAFFGWRAPLLVRQGEIPNVGELDEKWADENRIVLLVHG